jgi:predicted ester cyclase
MASGSADMVGTGSAGTVETKPAPPPPPPPPPAKTADEMAARYQECWGLWNDGKWDAFKTCYTADAVSSQPGSAMPDLSGADAILADSQNQRTAFPDMHGDLQLVLQNGNHAVGIAVLTGTNTGPMKGPQGDMKPSNKKIGVLFAHTVDFNDQAQATKEQAYWDMSAMLQQIGAIKMPGRKPAKAWAKAPEVVIAKNDDAEKANVAVFQATVDAFNKHDDKAFGATLDKKLQWIDVGSPKDLDLKGAIADSKSFWKGFSDVKISPDQMWGAGDYVVMMGTIGGTNDGDLPMMKLKKTGKTFTSPFLHVVKIEGGKITKSWIFYQPMGMAAQLMPAAK